MKTTLNTRENIKTEIYQQPKLIWPKACLEKKNFEKWTPSQRSAHICACFEWKTTLIFLMEDNFIFLEKTISFFFKWKTTSIFVKTENDLILKKW